MTPAEYARMIPDEVVGALQAALNGRDLRSTEVVRAAFAAGLAAWEGSHIAGGPIDGTALEFVVLPLQEPTDDHR